MITVLPAALATTALVANQLSLTLSIKEKLCRSHCPGMSDPIVSVNYRAGSATFTETSTFVPVTAIITVVYPGYCCGNTQIFAEKFTVAFQGQTAAPSNVAIASVGSQEAITGSCNSNQLEYLDSITVTLTTA